MSYCFNGDDIAIGPSFAILSQGSRRVQLDRLDAAQIATLKRMRPGQRLGEVEPSFAELLEHHGLLTRSLPNHKRRWHHDLFPLRLPSRVVLTMASPLTVLTYSTPPNMSGAISNNIACRTLPPRTSLSSANSAAGRCGTSAADPS